MFDSQMGSQFRSQNRNKNRSVFWTEIPGGLLSCSNDFIIISESESKVENTKLFVVLSTFDRDPGIIIE